MNIAIVGGNLPYPPTAGNRVRTLNLTLRLACAHRITLIFHRGEDPGADREAVAYFGDHGVETIGVDQSIPSKSGPAFYARLAANLASPLPYSVATYNSPALVQAIRRHAERRSVDVWQAEGVPFMESLRVLSGTRKVVMAHNVESQIWQRYHETERQPHKKWYIARQWMKFERFERRSFAEAKRVVAVSDEDAALVRQQFGTNRVDVVDNGIDRAYFASVEPDREVDRIVFLGSFEWRPNLDAVALLLDRIFPRVLAAMPSAKLDLVGRNPPESLARRVFELPNVKLHANVPDVRPFLARSGVMAVPLRIGGGSRLKILEALASGLPVVSTRIGAEGLRLTSGRDLTIVDPVEEMAEALLGCIRDPNAARAMAEAGRRLVLERYDWDVLAARLGRIWEACLN
ncbi:Glycosyltransferase involved in cell wall bisynthesis [Singulisphaera sp. GP187]|uniref:glycosyltransferase family 4 protein n=1 Tax=Singulisphaera sp. GP187 TaxID=1882752 RepID=UPI000927469C|nr:glycosyltransferase family 4 protein [Singulisphaera sp. GP187]SIO61485.1 Glycosyltransferase involved in cell wall bisynthesis [Singulisphaera sp. GP187]